MTKMNYSGNHSRYIPSHTEHEKYLSWKAYKPNLNSPVTITKADGTKTTEKALTQHQIDNPKIEYKPKPGTKAHKRMLRKQKIDEGNHRTKNLKTTQTHSAQIN